MIVILSIDKKVFCSFGCLSGADCLYILIYNK